MASASIAIRGNVTGTTLGSGGMAFSALATTRSNHAIGPEGLPIRTILVRPPDCSRIHSATELGRRPMVRTRSGQGGSSGSERSRSM